MGEIIIERTTLWDLLSEPSISLQLPRFALFLILAIISEIFCSKKKVCLMCSIPTAALQLATGLWGIITLYYVMTSEFMIGERIIIPLWYYPSTIAIVTGVSLVFIRGARRLLKARLTSNCIMRCLVFGTTVYFAITAIITPTRVNQALDAAEKKQNLRFDPIACSG